MLDAIALVLLLAWILGVVSTHTVGGFVHLFLVAAVVMFAVHVVRARRVR